MFGNRFGGGRPARPQHNIPSLLQPPMSKPNSNMNNHMQGLKDIDMELELLKRKREIIEQQQQMLTNSYKQRNDYDEQYNESREGSRFGDGHRRGEGYGEGRKRVHQVPVWEGQPPPKRFSENPWRPEPRVEPRAEPRPPAPRPRRPAPPPRRPRDFQPSRVSKPAPAPKPLAKYEPAVRKRLVAAAAADEQWVVRADVEPSAKLHGRLELGLGAIMKDAKAANPEFEHVFRANAPLRAMKAAVRERVRNAMIGKQALSIDSVRNAYYELYPCRKHEYVLMKGLEFLPNSKSVFESDDPETFFKNNMQYLMSNKLEEMIHQLQEIYGSGGNVSPMLFPKKVRSRNYKASNTDATQTNDGEGNKTEAESKAQDESVLNESSELDTSTTVDEKAKKDTAEKKEEIKKMTLKFINDEKYIAFDKLMTHKIMHLLKTHIPDILKIMNLNKMYRDAKASIYNETKKMLTKQDDNKTGSDSQNEQNPNTPEKPRAPPAQYFVKILGRPGLPKRKAMEQFFALYQPRIIKKHRNIHNLLFVGFNDKETFNKILEADGTTIGRFTLDIKISQRGETRIDNNKYREAAETPKIETDTDKCDAKDLDQVLDNQIDELLDSIKKSEYGTTEESIVKVEISEQDNLSKNKGLEDGTNNPENNEHCESQANDDTIDEDVVEATDVPQNVEQNATVENANENSTSENGGENVTHVNEENAIVKETATIEINEGNAEIIEINEDNMEEKDTISQLKNDDVVEVPNTPTRASARLATPGGVRTRRMSKLPE